MALIRVKGHYSTREGTRFYVRPHYMKENPATRRRAQEARKSMLNNLKSPESRRIRVKGHYSTSRRGRREYIKPHYMTENKGIFNRARRRERKEERVLRSGGTNKYAIGEALRFTKKHPGYSTSIGIYQNVEKGHEYNRHERNPYLETGRQLQAIANLNTRINPRASAHFREAAKEAFRLHEERECKNGKCSHRR